MVLCPHWNIHCIILIWSELVSVHSQISKAWVFIMFPVMCGLQGKDGPVRERKDQSGISGTYDSTGRKALYYYLESPDGTTQLVLLT